MGCTVREKHIRTNRRSRSVKSTPSDLDHHHRRDVTSSSSSLAKSMLESGFKPWTFNNNNINNDNNINMGDNENVTQNQNPNFEECGGWGYCTEEQLEEILLKNLEFSYNEVISKLVSLGYDEEIALKAVLRNGHCYGGMDVLTNILHNSLAYLNSGCCGNEAGSEESELVFSDLRHLEEYSLAGMVCLLQQVRPHLSRGDAMWCLLMSDLHVGRASTIEIPVIPSPNGPCGNGMGNVSGGIENVGGSGIGVPPGLCKFHGGWGFGSGGNSEMFVNGGNSSCSEGGNQREIDCPKRFNLSPSMRSLLKRNVAAFAAGFRAKQQLDMNSQLCISLVAGLNNMKGTSVTAQVPVQLPQESCENNHDVINSILNKFQELNLDDSLDSVSDDQKDEVILTLLHQIKDLQKQVKERKEWAHQKALQAAKKLSNDLTELKILRMEREETQRLKKGKQTLEDTTMKRLSEMENALRKASSQVDRANAAVRQLEIENAEIRAEMEASKLSASESVATCLEVAKREKKCLKKLLAWEKQKTKLQEEISAEKQKIADLQELLIQIHAAQKEAEEKWRQELKEKELSIAQVEEERRVKEASEGNSKRKLEALGLRMEIEFQRHKDDLQRLKQELSRLKASAECINPLDALETFGSGSPEAAHTQSDTIAHLLCELDEPQKEAGSERQCLVCTKEEVSVVFLPCAHQVMCANCGEDYGKKGKAACPCCRVPIEQRIRVFGATS